MNQIITTSTQAVVPQARVDFSVRVATPSDIPFMDSMQKKFGKQLGYFPTKQFEGYVEMGAVLVAVDGVGDAVGSGVGDPAYRSGRPVGYVISRDRYLKRDELGVVYQLCVAPGTQRKLVGASLIAEVFRRSAYGCKLYCCWCAQDIDANYFWESIGFVPIAFRAGSAKKSRVHIFWQRRVHQDDVTTAWWYPCATNGGAIREDRLVFPIPPGVHWKDVSAPVGVRGSGEENGIVISREPKSTRLSSSKSESRTPKNTAPVAPRRVQFGAPSLVPVAPVVEERSTKPRAKRVKVKVDPVLVAKARELRDRWMECVNADPSRMIGGGKYEPGKQLAPSQAPGASLKLLEAA